MKPSLYTRLSVVAIAAMLAACGGASSTDKKAQLEKLKVQQSETAQEIKKLEAEIEKETPDSLRTVRSKEVVIAEVKTSDFDHFVQTQGSVEAEDNILVSAKSMGVLTAVYVKEGESVTKGQTLAQIDNSVIQQNVAGMKAQLELARTLYQRQKNLWDQKIGTEVQYLQAKTNVESLEKQLAGLEEQGSMLRITSPISGTVDEVSVKVGENIAPGAPAIRVVNTSDLKLKIGVSEAYITDIKKGDKVLVEIPELKKTLTTAVTFVGKNIDLLSRTFPIEVKLPSLPGIRPNMTGVVKVVFHTEKNALTVPVNVVQNIKGEKVVYTAETDGKNTVARKKVVTVNGVYNDSAQIDKGLSTGDKIITVGYQGLTDGQVIKIRS